MNQSVEKKIAKLLIELGCVELSPSKPFSYASGLKGPIYCDNRKVLSHPKARNEVMEAFTQRLSDSGWDYDCVAGLATAGIPHAALIAHHLECPMSYVRSKPKGHGKRNQVEGDVQPGQSMVLVEDLVNQGASLNEALLGVEDADLRVSGCLAIVHYQMPAAESVIERWNLNFEYLTNFESLCLAALEMGRVQQNELDLLRSWQSDPVAWSTNNS